MMGVISKQSSLCKRYAPDPIDLLPYEGERQLAGETLAEVIDVQLHPGHGRSGESSD